MRIAPLLVVFDEMFSSMLPLLLSLVHVEVAIVNLWDYSSAPIHPGIHLLIVESDQCVLVFHPILLLLGETLHSVFFLD
jgi:hypothetical protein